MNIKIFMIYGIFNGALESILTCPCSVFCITNFKMVSVQAIVY